MLHVECRQRIALVRPDNIHSCTGAIRPHSTRIGDRSTAEAHFITDEATIDIDPSRIDAWKLAAAVIPEQQKAIFERDDEDEA